MFLKRTPDQKKGKIAAAPLGRKNGWKAEFALSIDFSLRKVTYAILNVCDFGLRSIVMKLNDFITKGIKTKTQIGF